MIPGEGVRQILELATEDYPPLFDVTAVVRAVVPAAEELRQIELAREVVGYLKSRGYIRFYYDCWAEEGKRSGIELSVAEIRVEMREQEDWLAHERQPPDGRWVTIGATEAGEEALARGEFV